ncbi:MAG: alpha/beta fold hydrolase [Pirellulaceae bacterium]
MSAIGFPPFRPPVWMKNGHAQTVLGAYLPSPYTTQPVCHRVVLDDGDHLLCFDDRPNSWKEGDRVALLVHGLCGSSTSGYMNRVAAKLNDVGVRTFRKTLRGFGEGVTTARRSCHAGLTADVAAALEHAISLCPGSPITLVGFSLGANLVLKLLGELEDLGPAALDSAVAAAPPIDLIHCARHLRLGLNRLYDWSFIRSLHALVHERRRSVPDLHDLPLRSLPRRLLEFDDQYTAPLIGYAGATEYYTEASSARYLHRIRRRTLIVTAADDPVIPVEMFDNYEMSDCVTLRVTEHGGHLGWIGVSGVDPDRRWLDWRIVEWVLALDARQPEAAKTPVQPSNTGSARSPLVLDPSARPAGGLAPSTSS